MMTVMRGDWYGWGWGWMMLMPLLWIALIGVISWAVIRVVGRPSDRAADKPRETPQEILDRRFASGEIDADVYSEARDRLAGRWSESP
jgi:putative membrane protein